MRVERLPIGLRENLLGAATRDVRVVEHRRVQKYRYVEAEWLFDLQRHFG